MATRIIAGLWTAGGMGLLLRGNKATVVVDRVPMGAPAGVVLLVGDGGGVTN